MASDSESDCECDIVFLVDAIENGCVKCTKEFVDMGMQNYHDDESDDESLLHMAVNAGCEKIVKIIAEGDNDILKLHERECRDYGIPIAHAVAANNVGIVKVLIKTGSNLIKTWPSWDCECDNLLHLAAKKKVSKEMLELLIEAGVPLDGEGEDLGTPLSAAIAEVNLEAVKVFLEHDAKITVTVSNGCRTSEVKYAKQLTRNFAKTDSEKRAKQRQDILNCLLEHQFRKLERKYKKRKRWHLNNAPASSTSKSQKKKK